MNIGLGLKRFAKATAALALAGLATQITPICDLVPANLQHIMAIFNYSCTALLGTIILAAEKGMQNGGKK